MYGYVLVSWVPVLYSVAGKQRHGSYSKWFSYRDIE